MTIKTASELLSEMQKALSDKKRKEVLDLFIGTFNTLATLAARDGRPGVNINLKVYPVEYRKDVFDLLEDSGLSYTPCSTLDTYFISWN